MKHEVLLSLGIMLTLSSCRYAGSSDSDSTEGVGTDSVISTAEPEPFIANNDIGMTVKSVANTINIGERLDSTDFNFEGVLTDGIGMPLFTDLQGMPGQWEIEVVDSTELRIRNTNAGNLRPHELLEYLSTTLGDGGTEMQPVEEMDRGDTHIQIYRYGRTELSVQTRPQQIGETGEVAPIMEITLRADSLVNKKAG